MRARRGSEWVIRVVAAVAAVVIGYGHFFLWQKGYRYTPVGSLFLVNFAGGIVIGLLLLFGPRRVAAVLGAGLSVVTFGAFALSRGPGVPTFHGTFTEKGFLRPTASLHLIGLNPALLLMIAEGVGFVACVVLLALGGVRGRSNERAERLRRPSAAAPPAA
jgi:hypothetical protein